MTEGNTNAKIDSHGNLEFDNLDTNQLLAILASRIQAMDERIVGLEQRIDGKMVTRDDLQRFGERMQRLESQLKRHEEWIDKQQAIDQKAQQGLGAKFKAKLADYLVLGIIMLGAAAIIGGISFYVSDNQEIDELRRDIEQIRSLK